MQVSHFLVMDEVYVSDS